MVRNNFLKKILLALKHNKNELKTSYKERKNLSTLFKKNLLVSVNNNSKVKITYREKISLTKQIFENELKKKRNK